MSCVACARTSCSLTDVLARECVKSKQESIFTGSAEVLASSAVDQDLIAGYAARYAQGMAGIGMAREQHEAANTAAIHVNPTSSSAGAGEVRRRNALLVSVYIGFDFEPPAGDEGNLSVFRLDPELVVEECAETWTSTGRVTQTRFQVAIIFSQS